MQQQHAGPPVFCGGGGVFLTYLLNFLFCITIFPRAAPAARQSIWEKKLPKHHAADSIVCARFCHEARSLFGSSSIARVLFRKEQKCVSACGILFVLCGWLLYIGLITFDFASS
jgi:hypothetical protein